MERVKERGGAFVPFFARPKSEIPFFVVPRSFFVPKPHGNACYTCRLAFVDLSRIAINKAQLEAWTDNTVICLPEPRSHFFVFSQSGVTQESLVAYMTDV